MPDGHFEMSPRSSDSKSDALIFVLAEMDDSAICRRSRSLRSRMHQGVSGMLSSGTIGGHDAACKFSSRVLLRGARRSRMFSIHAEVGIARWLSFYSALTAAR